MFEPIDDHFGAKNNKERSKEMTDCREDGIDAAQGEEYRRRDK